MSERRPHICFVAPNAYPLLASDSDIPFAGGAELQQVEIAKGLVQRGYAVSMICLNFGQQEECVVDGIRVHRAFGQDDGIPLLRFVWPRLTSIWKCMRRADADIYYQRAGSMLTGVMAAFCRGYDRKSIFAVAGKTKIRFSRDRWLYEFGMKHVDRVVVQNEAQARVVEKQFGRGTVLIPNIYRTGIAVGTARLPSILWVGMIRQVKRPDVFLDVVESLPELDFVMVGGASAGEGSLYSSIRSRAEELKNLDFIGFVSHANVGRYFDRASLFVNTSDSEGFPNTFLQSWARGIPTISFVDCGAQADGKSIGIQVASVAEMTATISELMGNAEKREGLGQAAKAYVDRNHKPQHVLDLYEDLFSRMLQTEPSTHREADGVKLDVDP